MTTYYRTYPCKNCGKWVQKHIQWGKPAPVNPICPNCGMHIDGTEPRKDSSELQNLMNMFGFTKEQEQE